jgi:hypothetical protein
MFRELIMRQDKVRRIEKGGMNILTTPAPPYEVMDLIRGTSLRNVTFRGSAASINCYFQYFGQQVAMLPLPDLFSA